MKIKNISNEVISTSYTDGNRVRPGEYKQVSKSLGELMQDSRFLFDLGAIRQATTSDLKDVDRDIAVIGSTGKKVTAATLDDDGREIATVIYRDGTSNVPGGEQRIELILNRAEMNIIGRLFTAIKAEGNEDTTIVSMSIPHDTPIKVSPDGGKVPVIQFFKDSPDDPCGLKHMDVPKSDDENSASEYNLPIGECIVERDAVYVEEKYCGSPFIPDFTAVIAIEANILLDGKSDDVAASSMVKSVEGVMPGMLKVVFNKLEDITNYGDVPGVEEIDLVSPSGFTVPQYTKVWVKKANVFDSDNNNLGAVTPPYWYGVIGVGSDDEWEITGEDGVTATPDKGKGPAFITFYNPANENKELVVDINPDDDVNKSQFTLTLQEVPA